MENKYYTPEIEEFHVGFEYEVKVYKKDEWIKCKWTELNVMSAEFNLDFGQAYDLPKVTVPDTIRVKYLDREDIESLGFTFTEDKWSTCVGFEIPLKETKKVILNWWWKEKQISIDVRVQGMLDKQVGGLTIKNKSELKKLLKQLGI
jgi:hypothetical protein